MAIYHSADRPRSESSLVHGRILLPVFAGTLFLSAFLLFSIQPFFTKLLLPRLGGSPSVWSVAMVFFQGMLLLGYGYAHALARFATIKVAAAIHVVVLLSAFVVLPIAIPAGWEMAPASGQATWLLGLFVTAVGLPFFAVSANGALLQAWFSRSGHKQADDPYFLYGASNVGSFASLILYIVAIEPLLTLPQQSLTWTLGYAGLVALIVGCAVLVMSSGSASLSHYRQGAPASRAVRQSPLMPLAWIGLGFLPSGLLVAVTAHITTDVAAAPFLWVAPLALFLLTFVLAFRTKPAIRLEALPLPISVLGSFALFFVMFNPGLPAWLVLSLHLGFYFVAALYCHSILYLLRPAAEGLTGFYLAMSFGGVLGGAFASLLAPVTFDWVAEYPILIVAMLLLRPRVGSIAGIPGRWMLGAALAAILLSLLAAQFPGFALEKADQEWLMRGILIALVVVQLRWQAPYLLLVAIVLPIVVLFQMSTSHIYQQRSFFGVVRVDVMADGEYNAMYHGTTLHGAEQVRDASGSAIVGRPVPLTYYHPKGGMAATIKLAQQMRAAPAGNFGVVGLGAGSVACYAQPQENWSFYEIDQTVVDAAKAPNIFRYLSVCTPQAGVVLGDARLTIAMQPDASFDYLLIDAFSSDAIPTHLMTREAIEMFRTKVKPDGILAFHISNRFLELPSVMAAIADDLNLPIRIGDFASDPMLDLSAASVVAAMSSNPKVLDRLDADPHWKIPNAGTTEAWTDDYSNILAALWRRYAE